MVEINVVDLRQSLPAYLERARGSRALVRAAPRRRIGYHLIPN